MPVAIEICNRPVRILMDNHRIEPTDSSTTPPGIPDLRFTEFKPNPGDFAGKPGLYYIGSGDDLIYLVLQEARYRGSDATLHSICNLLGAYYDVGMTTPEREKVLSGNAKQVFKL